MDGSPPFEELLAFRTACFQAMPASMVNTLSLSAILQAYVSAYQNNQIWKDCFKDTVGIMSVQIARDVEAFKRDHRFAAGAVMALMTK
jgi:hypothetical protein